MNGHESGRRWTVVCVTLLALSAAPNRIFATEANERSNENQATRVADAAQARRELARTMDSLDAYLRRGGPEVSVAWKRWLDWQRLVEQVGKGGADRDGLLRYERKLRRNVPGLEQDPFRRLRQALKAFAAHVELADSPRPAALFAGREQELIRRTVNLGPNPPHPRADACGRMLEWFRLVDGDRTGLVRDTRRKYAVPNATVRVSRRFLDFLAQRAIVDTQTFTSFSQGVRSVGNASTTAQVGVQLIPSAKAASVDLTLDGAVAMPDIVSTRRRVSILSSAEVEIHARKRVTLDDKGIRATSADTSAKTDLRLMSAAAPRRLIERLAWRRANRLRPQAAADTSRRVAAEIESQADDLSSDFLSKAQRVYCDQVRMPLIRLDSMPERLEFTTTDDHLNLVLLQRNSWQLSASRASPPFRDHDDLAARVHESFFNNLASGLLAGRTIRDRQWLEMMNLLTGQRPRALWVHDRSTPWSVMFAEELPLSTRMVDGYLDVVLRLSSVRSGDEAWHVPVRVDARFELQVTRDGPALVRAGDIEVSLAARGDGGEYLPVTDIRRLLARKFAAILPAELYFDGLVPPTGGALGKLRALVLRDFSTERGWLAFGYGLGAEASVEIPDNLAPRIRQGNR